MCVSGCWLSLRLFFCSRCTVNRVCVCTVQCNAYDRPHAYALAANCRRRCRCCRDSVTPPKTALTHIFPSYIIHNTNRASANTRSRRRQCPTDQPTDSYTIYIYSVYYTVYTLTHTDKWMRARLKCLNETEERALRSHPFSQRWYVQPIGLKSIG